MAPPKNAEKPGKRKRKNFLGKHIAVNDPSILTAADFIAQMSNGRQKKSLRTCTALMMRSNVDSLIVTDENVRVIGTVSLRA